MWPCLSYLIAVTVHSDLLWSSAFVTSRLNCNSLPDNWQIPAVFLVRRSSPRNSSPLLHRTVTVANRVPRLALSGILTVGGVIVTFNSGAGLWRARVSQIRPAAPLCPALNFSGVVAGMATGPGCPAEADVASNTPASPTSCFISRCFPLTADADQRQQGCL